MDEKVIEELDLNKYIMWFVNEFNTYFPGLYLEEDLFNMVRSRVDKIYLAEFPDRLLSGNYNEESFTIMIDDINDDHVLFHEFVHALRSFYYHTDRNVDLELNTSMNGYDEAMRKFHLADEGFTELVTVMYDERKRKNNSNITLIKPSKNQYFSPYMYGALYFNQLNMFYKMLYPGRDLINDYLKGENIYKYLFDVVYRYLCEINEDVDENLETAYRLSNIILTYLADFGETKSFNQDEYEGVTDKYVALENINKSILLTVPREEGSSPKIKEFLSDSFVFANIPSTEDRLLAAILGVDIKTYSIEDINNIITNYIIDNENEERS